MNANPNCEITRNHKTKEKAVAEFLKKSFPRLNWICDKKISNTATSRRRPDICVDLGWFVLVVEGSMRPPETIVFVVELVLPQKLVLMLIGLIIFQSLNHLHGQDFPTALKK